MEDKSLGLQLPLIMVEEGGLSLGILQGMGKQAGAPPSGCRELGQRPRGAHLSPHGLANNFEQAGLLRGRGQLSGPGLLGLIGNGGHFRRVGSWAGWFWFFLMVFDLFSSS